MKENSKKNKKTENPLAMHPEEVKMLPKGELIKIRGAKENSQKPFCGIYRTFGIGQILACI